MINESSLCPRAQQLEDAYGLGVVVVLYRSADVIEACLRSLLEQRSAIGRIVLIDNCCPEHSVAAVEQLTSEMDVHLQTIDTVDSATPVDSCVELIRTTQNKGFAAGVNIGLQRLHADPGIGFFWVLNPDCELTPGCAEQVLSGSRQTHLDGGFALLGTRLCYHSPIGVIQSDGGICCTWTGRCRHVGQGRTVSGPESPQVREIDFISGASMVASRQFFDLAGPMPESYFLYYEEVAWAWKRGSLPLIMLRDAVVLHHGGTAIGSGAIDRLPSALSNYFNFRNRMRFMWRHRPIAAPVSYVFSLLKIMQTVLKGGLLSASAAFRGLHGMAPSADVRESFNRAEQKAAFGRAYSSQKQTTPRVQRVPDGSPGVAKTADP